jgi:hypothetical protein
MPRSSRPGGWQAVRVVALLPVTGACLAAGCGYAQPSTSDQVRASAETFVSSCARDLPESATDVLTEPLQATFANLGPARRACAQFLGIDPRGLSDVQLDGQLRAVSVQSVRLEGGSARVTLAGAAGRRSTLELGLTDGEWLVQSPPKAA